MNRYRTLSGRLIQSDTVGSTLVMTLGLGARLILTTLAFIIVSRRLGASEFGAFGSVAALVGIIACFSGWGADVLIVKSVSQTAEGLERALGRCLAFLSISAPILAGLAFVLAPVVISTTSNVLVALVVLADILFSRITVVGIACYRAVDRPVGAAWLHAGSSGFRLIAALAWQWASSSSALSWSAYYCAASGAFACASLWLVWRDFGPPALNICWADWRSGFHFSLLAASNTAAINIATPVVAVLSDLAAAGVFVAAMRIVEAACIPATALMFSAFSRFIRAAKFGGSRASRDEAIGLLPVSLLTGLTGTISVAAVSVVAPTLLGASFAYSGDILLLLSPLPIISALYYLAADLLVSTLKVGTRVAMQCAMPIVNVAICTLLVPPYGALGAAISILISNAILAGLAWVSVIAGDSALLRSSG